MKKNIFLLTIDSIRADRFFGPKKTAVTPNFDFIRENGLFFEQNISSCDQTGTSLATIFTGKYPMNSGVTQFNFNLNSLIPLDISGFALGDSFTLRLEGTSQDGFVMVDGNGEIEWKKRIVVEDGSAITIPYAFSHDFVIPNIKADNYTLKLFAENKQLNDGYTNSFVEYKVFSP